MKCFMTGRRVRVKSVSIYEFVFTFAPCGTEMRGVFHVFENGGPHYDRRRFPSSEFQLTVNNFCKRN